MIDPYQSSSVMSVPHAIPHMCVYTHVYTHTHTHTHTHTNDKHQAAMLIKFSTRTLDLGLRF